MIILIAVAALVCTLLGGLFALKYHDKLHLVLGFSAGAVIGVAFFDLLPEAIELSKGSFDVSVITSIIALGFMLYMILDRFVVGHSHADEHCENENHRGRLGAGSLSVHSFLDGVAIGLAFQVSEAVGAIVTIAVLVHDFSDGINTVSLILKNGGTRKEAFKWLTLDALAPVLGILSTMLFSVPESFLAILLALFCGFFLYIGASDLLPESHHRHPTYWTTLATILGVLVLYGAIKIAGV
ncbi:ZIP family metal transporter [Patescibacteria group bacterium]|nr:MAG: ZIP family metal transporter [Patescibacteria group bacterium]